MVVNLYLCHKDVITGDVIHILINLSIQLSGQLNKNPPSVCNPFSLEQIKMKEKIRYKNVTKQCIHTHL